MNPKTGMRRRNSVLEQMGLGLKKDIDVDVGSRFGNGSRDRLGHGFGQDSPGQRRNSVLGGILGGGTGNVASQVGCMGQRRGSYVDGLSIMGMSM